MRWCNRDPPRKNGLLAASEIPGLHQLIHDNSPRATVDVVVRLLSIEWES